MAQVSANSNIQIALIGAGGMGQGDASLATQIEGVKLVAACDLYQGRLERCREIYGKDLFTTRDHREVLARRDVDAVIIATPDHWHATITREALAAGKHVYCEKPMVQKIEEGQSVVDAQKASGKVLQIGSQYASSMVFQKARQLLESGAIGKLNMVEAWLDRNTATGAWQYTIPPDASKATVDWDRFLGHAPKRPFDATRFFRWRNYKDYGTGLAGDLYVHLLTGLHVVTGSTGPNRVYSTGGLRYWKDGRDVPDVMLACMDYPGFTFTLRVNFKAAVPVEDFGFRFVGSEGVMWASMTEVRVAKTPRETEPGYTINEFAADVRKKFLEDYRKQYPVRELRPETLESRDTMLWALPRSYSAHLEHHRNFYNGIRTGTPFFEDGVFGLRTAGPALLTGVSLDERKVCGWDPEAMKRTA